MPTTIIRPNRAWWRPRFAEIWEYRDLLTLLVRRDFVSKYKQTVLGPAWFAIQPLLTTVVFTVVFGRVAQIPTDGIPPVLFYLVGLLGWTYFAQTFNAVSTTFVANAGVFGKVYFPRLVVPLSISASNLIALAINLAIALAAVGYFAFTGEDGSVTLRWQTIMLPIPIMLAAIAALGAGLWVSALTAKYRDLTHLSGFLAQLLMYATPVIYPMSAIPERWRWLAALNPMASVCEGIKWLVLGKGEVGLTVVAIGTCTAVILLITGLVAFQRTERNFIDTV